MSMLNGMNISASGMSAQRLRMDIIAQNIANVNTTRNEKGEVYRRQTVVMAEKEDTQSFRNVLANIPAAANLLDNTITEANGQGVKVTAIAEDHVTSLKSVYDPSHPDADENGYVWYPNVDTVTEMTDLIDATRSYEANVTAFNATKNMLLKGLELGK